MNECDRIADQLWRAYGGPAWHGPSLRELLQGVTGAEASARPLARAHTLWEIVGHIRAWTRFAVRRLRGEDFEVSDEENFSTPTDAADEAWLECCVSLEQETKQACEAVRALPDTRLSEKVGDKPYDAYFLLHGLVQHDLYHAGQIAVLKRALRER